MRTHTETAEYLAALKAAWVACVADREVAWEEGKAIWKPARDNYDGRCKVAWENWEVAREAAEEKYKAARKAGRS